MSNKQVVIVGNVGTGKTTLLQSLKEYATIRVLPADELFRTNPFFPLSKQDPQRWVFTNDLWFLLRRFGLVQAALKEQGEKHLVIDSGIFISYVYGWAHAQIEKTMTQEEWQFFEEYFDHYCKEIPLPDLVVILTAPYETLRQRIEQRNRDWEVKSYFKYIESIEESIKHLESKLMNLNIPILQMDTQHKTPDKVAEAVYSELNRGAIKNTSAA